MKGNKRKSTSRREVIRIGAGLLLAGGIGTSTASARSRSAFGSFDPSNERAVDEFVQKLRGHPRPQRVYKSLSDEQQNVVDRALTPKKVRTGTRTPVQAAGMNETFEVGMESIGGIVTDYTLFRFWHTISWDYDGSSVSDTNHSARGVTVHPMWSFIRVNDDYKDVNGDSFTAQKQGTFEYGAGDAVEFGSANPWSRLRGNENGDGTLVDYGDCGSECNIVRQ